MSLGYKLRESVWRALKTRGKAIRTALDKYNKIAPKMDPPAPILQWKQLMEYSFISEFELLKHAHSHRNISTEPWALPLNREMALKYHKIKRAYEEIIRVNIEAPRLRTSIRDEHQLYTHHINRLLESDPALSSELHRIFAVRRRVNATHIQHLDTLEALPGYSGRRGPGIRRGASSFADSVESREEMTTHDEVSADDVWRQGRTDGSSMGHIEQDAPDDEISEGLLDLTEQFSADLRLVDTVPENMLYEFKV